MADKEIAPYKAAIMEAEQRFHDIVTETGVAISFKKESINALIACESNEYLLKIATKNPKSLRNAVWNVATVGLSLDKSTSYAFLVPRKGEICLDVSYRGLVKIATDTGSILWAKAEIVHEQDQFVMKAIGEMPEHTFSPFGDRGDAVGVYCVAKTVDGDFLAGVMTKKEIDKIREMSESDKGKFPEYSPWNTFEFEMWKKAIIKRESKSWPKTERSDRLQQAIEVVNEHQGIDFEKQHTPEQYSYYLQTIDHDNGEGQPKGQPLEHYCFLKSLEYETVASLVGAHKNTIEDGFKAKENKRIGLIFDAGENIFNSTVVALNESEDDFEILALLEDVPQDAHGLLFQQITPEAMARIEQVRNAA